jgi:adenine deaminase
MTRDDLMAVARGERPADLVLRGARLVNVLAGEIHEADLAIADGRVIGWGDYRGHEELDLGGAWVAPGLLDAHVHLESSLLSVGEFARAVAPHGTTGVFVDPHEVANVCGLAGVDWVLAAGRAVPLDVWVNAPSCVPASPFDDPGAVLDAAAVRELLAREGVLGLAEMMNYPGTIFGDPEVAAKLAAAAGRPIDGHAPGLRGRELMAYLLAGPSSDHECCALDEAREKLRAGCYLLVREGSASKNLAALLDVRNAHNARRLCFCCDDIQSEELLAAGHMDRIVRAAIAQGVEPVVAVQMATLNTAERFGVADRVGCLAPGRRADFVVLDDLHGFRVRAVWKDGVKVAEDGQALFVAPVVDDTALRGSVRLGAVDADTFALPWSGGPARVIRVHGALLLTEHEQAVPTVTDGQIVADPARDLLKAACLERHRSTGLVGVGLVAGFGLQRGALASSVGHDSHNLTVVGASDRAMALATQAVAEAGGGLAVADDEGVRAVLPLPLAGLMSDQPATQVAAGVRAVQAAARTLGTHLPDPFMTLSFVSLSVIPKLRLTPRGLIDVDRFAPVSLAV